MNRFIFILCFFSLQFLTAQNPDIQITNGILIINGTKLPEKEWPLNKIEKLLGQANRTTDKANIIHTWDHFGIVAYEENNEGGTGKVLEIHVYFNLEDGYDFLPSTSFEGSMIIENYSFKCDCCGKPNNNITEGEELLISKVSFGS